MHLLTCRIVLRMSHNLKNDLLAGRSSSAAGTSTSIQWRSRPKSPRNSEHDPLSFVESSDRHAFWVEHPVKSTGLLLMETGELPSYVCKKRSDLLSGCLKRPRAVCAKPSR